MRERQGAGQTGGPGGRAWLLADPGSLPAHLKARAVPLALVAMLPHEIVGLSEPSLTSTDVEDVPVAELAARGWTASEIASRLHISQRTAYRRLARLRRSLGARSASELTALLNERGF